MGENIVDIMLDANTREVSYYSYKSKSEIFTTDLPTGRTWYPHFNLKDKAKMRLEYISESEYKKCPTNFIENRQARLSPVTLLPGPSSILRLTDNNTVARMPRNDGVDCKSEYGYVLGNVGTRYGKRAWRCQTKNAANWILYAVSDKKTFDIKSYTDRFVWGIAGSGQVYKAGSCSPNSITKRFMGDNKVDMMIDADAGKLFLYSHKNHERFEIAGLPSGRKWYPLFSLYNPETEIRCEYIDESDFGK